MLYIIRSTDVYRLRLIDYHSSAKPDLANSGSGSQARGEIATARNLDFAGSIGRYRSGGRGSGGRARFLFSCTAWCRAKTSSKEQGAFSSCSSRLVSFFPFSSFSCRFVSTHLVAGIYFFLRFLCLFLFIISCLFWLWFGVRDVIRFLCRILCIIAIFSCFFVSVSSAGGSFGDR